MNPYEILGVAEGASLDEIKAAYREQAQRYHPDVGGDAWVFRQVEWAFSVLTNDAAKSPAEEQAQSQPPPTPDSCTPDTRQDDVDIRYVIGVFLVVGLVWWFGWVGIFRWGLWLGLAMSSGAAVYCACSAWTAGNDLRARRKYLLFSVILIAAAGITFTLLALTIVSTSHRRLPPTVALAEEGTSPASIYKGTT